MTGALHLPGKLFEHPGQSADFLLPSFCFPLDTHELQIVDDDEIQSLFSFQAPAFILHLQNGDARRVVDINLRLGQPVNSDIEILPVSSGQITRFQFGEFHAGIDAQKTLSQLLFGHFQREDENLRIPFDSGVLCDIQHESGLSLTRPGRQYNEIRFLQAGSAGVEIGKPRGKTGQTAVHSRHPGRYRPCWSTEYPSMQ